MMRLASMGGQWWTATFDYPCLTVHTKRFPDSEMGGPGPIGWAAKRRALAC